MPAVFGGLRDFVARYAASSAPFLDLRDDAALSRANEASRPLSRAFYASGLLRTSSGESAGSNGSGASSSSSSVASMAAAAGKLSLSPRSWRYPSRRRATARRELLLFSVVIMCLVQLAFFRQAETSSFVFWIRENMRSSPEPGRPPARTAFLPAPEVLPASADGCADALHIPKVALMFLTTGNLHHEDVWRMWLRSAQGLLPAQTVERSICNADASPIVSRRLQRAAHACLLHGNGTEVNEKTHPSNAIDAQHLFSVYVHAPPEFQGYEPTSLWAGRLVKHRVSTSWGAHTLVEATRNLVWEAYKDPLNTKFVLLSESDVPIYDPLTMWQQLQAEQRSRLDTCRHHKTSPWRWDPRMETSRLKFQHWRKSPQWLTLTRKHAGVVLNDEEVYRRFERHCWSSWDDRKQRWHRDCFSDEHYFATLMAVEGLQDEGVCESRGVSFTEWGQNSAHPKAYAAYAISAALFRRARGPHPSAAGAPTPPCDWERAQQRAQKLFVPASAVFANPFAEDPGSNGVSEGGAQDGEEADRQEGDDAKATTSTATTSARASSVRDDAGLSSDVCGALWRESPVFDDAVLPESCFLTARKFPVNSQAKVKQVFLQCGNGVNLLRQDVCEAEGGTRCDVLWHRVKSLVWGGCR